MSSGKGWSKYLFGMVFAMVMIFLLAGCGTESIPESTTQNTETEGSEAMLKLTIGETSVTVEWEDNESVEALKALCLEGALTIQMSMYGGFEQV
ncbi:MAG: hypothetical protein II601_00060, partial [Lachnospiraceae bacterium]|nr:hypothetical protein [Lachnospiraceae bacterium]